jgi:predicted nucleotidyltransferase
MFQKCSLLQVFEVFFVEPTTIHFVKEISKRIKLAPTSVRVHIKWLLKQNLIKRKKAKPFAGYVANRESEDFIFYKRVYNLYSLKELANFLFSAFYPKVLVVYGSYALGEDVEGSDLDIFVLSKIKKELDVSKFEKQLKRKIHLLLIDNLNKLDRALLKKIYNGIVLYGGF